MNAPAREVVELASSDYQLMGVSDRLTPPPPSVPPASANASDVGDSLDLDTTQVVPKLVLSELRYQARLRTNPAAKALVVKDDEPAAVVANDVSPADTAPPAVPVDVVLTSAQPTSADPTSAQPTNAATATGGLRQAVVVGLVALCVTSVALMTLVH